MKILLIEDEELAAEDLASAIQEVLPEAHIEAVLVSIKEGIAYFKKNELPDLIFSDIQLGDGLSFEIFQSVPIDTPVIFCTAYHEYTLHAFRSNGIDYLLKPITKESVREALNKYHSLRQSFATRLKLPADFYQNLLTNITKPPKSILVTHKDRIIPLAIEQVALFYKEYEVTFLLTFDAKLYPLTKSLEDLGSLVGTTFYRVNRQCLVNRSAVKEVSYTFSRKLAIELSVKTDLRIITVSKEKASSFLAWLSGTHE